MIGLLFFLAIAWVLIAGGLSSLAAPCVAITAAESSLAYWLETRISCLQANELGDYLAGIFAPAAFLLLVAQIVFQMSETRRAHDTALRLRNDEKLLSLLDVLVRDFRSGFSIVNNNKEQGWVLKSLQNGASSTDLFENLCKTIQEDARTGELKRIVANHHDSALAVSGHLKQVAEYKTRVSERYKSLIARNNPQRCAELMSDSLYG